MPQEQEPAVIQSTAGEPNIADQANDEGKVLELGQTRPSGATRRDKNRVHRMRHGMLSKYPFEVLISLGEDKRTLRRMERMFWAELRPQGMVGALLFDRFWFSYLRCLLAGRSASTTRRVNSNDPKESIPSIMAGPSPVLVFPDGDKASASDLQDVLLREMALVENYDRQVSREMYRMLAILILIRDHGTESLAEALARFVGKKTNSRGE